MTFDQKDLRFYIAAYLLISYNKAIDIEKLRINMELYNAAAFLTMAVDLGYIADTNPSSDVDIYKYLYEGEIITAFRARSLAVTPILELTKIKDRLLIFSGENEELADYSLTPLYSFLHPNVDTPDYKPTYSPVMRMYAQFSIHPMEEVILKVIRLKLIIRDDNTDSDVRQEARRKIGQIYDHFGIDHFGIMMHHISISPNPEHEKLHYLLNYLYEYAHILTRGNLQVIPNERLAERPSEQIRHYLQQLTDREIIETVGVKTNTPYRSEIIDQTADLLDANMQMFFLIDRTRAKYHSINQETTSGTSISDESVFMFGFGNALRYYTYEIADLLGSFYTDSVTGVTAFRRPENPQLIFTVDSMEDLTSFLELIHNTPGIETLQRRIETIYNIAEDEDQYLADITVELPVMTAEQRSLVRDFLREIFYTGMYMRRWKGPNHPFPLVESDTRCEIDPEPIVQQHLTIARALLDRMLPNVRSYVLNLHAIQYTHGGVIAIEKQAFLEEWQEVIAGRQCIRMASTRFVGTGYYYLQKLFQETIPGMDRAPERIQ